MPTIVQPDHPRVGQRLVLIALLFGCGLALDCSTASAQVVGTDVFWEGDVSDDWLTGANWSIDFVPEFNETAAVNTAIDPAGLARMNGAIPSFGNLRVEGGGTVEVNPGVTADVKGGLFLGGAGGDGTVMQSGGDVTFSSAGNGQGLYLGNLGGNGVFNMSGGSLVQTGGASTAQAAGWNWSFIGLGSDNGAARGSGEFNLSGTADVQLNARLNIGRGGDGTVNQTGGALQAPTIAIGDDGFNTNFEDGRGTYNISGGAMTASDELLVGNWTNTDGKLNVSGTANVVASNNMYVSNFGPARRDESPTGAWIEGVGAQAHGEVNISGGSVRVAHQFGIGRSSGGQGVMNLSGGIFETAEDLANGEEGETFIGRDSGNGIVNISDTGTFIANDAVVVGSGFDLNEGASPLTDFSEGTIFQTGGEFHIVDSGQAGAEPQLIIGHAAGRGWYNLSGGTATVDGDVRVGVETTFVGLVRSTGPEDITTASSNGQIIQTGGSLTIQGDLFIGQDFGSTGSYQLSGGVLDMTGGRIFFDEGAGSFTFDGGVLRDAGIVGFDLVNSGGTLQPGASPGVTNISGDYTQGAAGALDYEIAGLMEGETDLLDINGMANLDGTLNVTLLGGFEPSLGERFDVLTALGGVVGTFANEIFPSFNGLTFQAMYFPNNVLLEVVEDMGSMCLVGDTAPCSGGVDIDDLNAVRNNFGTGNGTDTSGIPGDTFPFDGLVDIDDLNAVRNNFGVRAEAVPEPAGLPLAAITLLSMLFALCPRCRTRRYRVA